MVLDQLTNWQRYSVLHAGFEAAFHALLSPGLGDRGVGRHAIDGERLYVLIARDPGRGREASKLESHRRYIDIQLTLKGDEQIEAVFGDKAFEKGFEVTKKK